MPSSKNSQSHPLLEKGSRMKTIIEFADQLQKRFLDGTNDSTSVMALMTEIRENTDRLHGLYQKSNIKPAFNQQLDDIGTRLWNLCNRLRRESVDESMDGKKLFVVGRAFAFHLLAVAHRSEKYQLSAAIRLIKLALKAGGGCIESSDLELASLVLQKAADYNSSLEDHLPSLSDTEISECESLSTEYFIMRTAMAWKEDRLDLAEHMFNKSGPLRKNLNADYSEKLADILYEIGSSLSAKQDFAMAVKWLERASDIFNDQILELLSREGVELRMTVLQAKVSALLGLNTVDGYERASSLVDYVESEVGTKPLVSLLKLDLLNKSPAETFDCDAYADVLRGLINTLSVSESTLKLLLHHIRKLHDKSPGLGCAVLDAFIHTVQRHQNDDWLGRLVITRIWMTVNERDSSEMIEAARRLLSSLPSPLPADATVAVQALLWKRLEASYAQGQFDMAEKWCRLGLHDMLPNSGPGNIAKLERKLLLCALSRNSMDDAISIVHSMSERTRAEPMTAYLVFKVAIRTSERRLAAECLEKLSEATDNNEYLSACIADSQHTGDISCAIEGLKKLLSKYEYSAPSKIHLPALLRSIVRLLYSLLSRSESGSEATQELVVEDLCDVFDTVVQAAQRGPEDEGGSKLFGMDELGWFARNAYNLGLKHVDTWNLRHTVRILTSCLRITDQVPSDISPQILDDLVLKVIFSRFVIASALVALARAQDNIEAQLQDYLLLRGHVSAFDAQLVPRLESMDPLSRKDMLGKLATLLLFDFEASICLKEWDDLSSIVLKAGPCMCPISLQSMADCLIRSEAPGQVLFATMRKIINALWELEDFEPTKLAKYVRLLFQATLPLREDLALQLIQDACHQAREASTSEKPWPAEEIEWLATTTFNHSVDHFSTGDDENAKQWASQAINLAHYCDDDGALEGIIHDKCMKLHLRDE